MRKQSLNTNGFGFIPLLVTVVVLVMIGSAGAYVYHRDHKAKVTATTTSSTSSKSSIQTSSGGSPTSADPYAGWKTYTSTVGGFTISYPTNWSIEGYAGQDNTTKVPASQLTGNENLVLLTSSTTPSNAFGIWLAVDGSSSSTSSLDSAFTQIPYDQGSILKTLPNRLAIWEANPSLTTNGHTYADTCTPFETSMNGGFGFKLNNGKYLDASMSFCYGREQTTTYTYNQQASSAELQQAISILSSVKQH